MHIVNRGKIIYDYNVKLNLNPPSHFNRMNEIKLNIFCFDDFFKKLMIYRFPVNPKEEEKAH